MELLPQYLVNGLVTGSFYALSALGLTLILGLMRVVNFAHGELYMMGGVMGWWATTRLGLDFFSGLLLVAVAMGAFGWLVDRLLIERIRDQGEEPGILLTIGLSIFLANTALLMVGTAPLKVEAPIAAGPVFLGTVVLTKLRLFAVAVCALLIVAAWLTIHKTRLGRAMRATFQDPMAARLVGIRTSSVYASTFAMGTVIASMAGMLLGSIYSAQVSVGGLVSMKAFVVVILGGMGSFAGAIAGGLLLGVAEALWGGYVATGWVDIIGFALVILALVFRPYGLFSKRVERA
ncbi:MULTISPECIES: branched-chain amino acid ABC transporter permease [unclassified Variovorax]|jgi:branched-chain amino acid transport system permease protein|uniref:branched-chain amino acid ABC transporter permease n=1 Tax=unclassified Variovorax TaxID=663243 RepID=UPI00076C61AC|nr:MULTISPECIES: branched-chain amino acid ABC transporter permease [unclassified Variovorax]KWT83571.1 High-affinity branched-chain amino acid transport system permease protein LivH [Variovorax sp. WDL1]PNG59577.1 High-affinity branched-chain amino acid transport system permease protein LivH [Variovorax sp. B4]PNG60632.1 High-affinity branched-chain amino acid transport system permease protein LivH [Variovorax sp. B2]VTV13471.1 LIV-I protein H [Variovorax sp. WDL1]